MCSRTARRLAKAPRPGRRRDSSDQRPAAGALGRTRTVATARSSFQLYDWCQRRGATFMCCRTWMKNDSAHVEQKDGAIVRHLVGYDRFASKCACPVLTRVSELLCLHMNLFQPVQKLGAKRARRSVRAASMTSRRAPASPCAQSASCRLHGAPNSTPVPEPQPRCSCAAIGGLPFDSRQGWGPRDLWILPSRVLCV